MTTVTETPPRARFARSQSWLTIRAGYWTLAVFCCLLIVTTIALDSAAPAGRRILSIHGEDPINYFGIAHSLMFNGNFDLRPVFQRMPPDGRKWTPIEPSGFPGSPWGVGYSILAMPFLGAGTAMDAISGHPADGYGRFAVQMYCFATVIFTGLGLMALFTFFVRAGKSWELPLPQIVGWSLFATFAVFFGTNVGYYTFSHLAHACTFLLTSLFLAQWWHARDRADGWSWFLLGLTGGLVSVCRWQDVVYLTVPLMADLLAGNFRKALPAWLHSRALYGAGIAIFWIPQVIEWKIIYGKYITIPQGPGFVTFPPRYILPLLSSSQNGWLTWTPLVVLGIAGLCYGVWKGAHIYLPLLAVILLEIGIVGGMSTWHGYDSFGSRYLLSTAPPIGFGLFTLLSYGRLRMKLAIAGVMVVCCLFTMIFAVQYRFDLIPTGSTLTFSEYFTSKFHLLNALHLNAKVRKANAVLDAGHPDAAIAQLEGLAQSTDNRMLLSILRRAYETAGRQAQADAITQRLIAIHRGAMY